MGWDLRLRTAATNGPIVHCDVSVEGRADDARWGKLTRPPELSGNPTSREILERVDGMDEGARILHISIWDTKRFSSMP
jgi:hypothetical protein